MNKKISSSVIKVSKKFSLSSPMKKVEGLVAQSDNTLDKIKDDFAIRSNIDLSENDREVCTLIADLHDQYNSENITKTSIAIQDIILKQIILTFGLSRLQNGLNKDGGFVTTKLNARKSIYAKERDKYERKDYVPHAATKSMKNVKLKNTNNDGLIKDVYTGNHIEPGVVDVDHVISAKEIHNDYGFMLSKKQKAEIGADRDNFKTIHQSLNRSKGSKSLAVFSVEKNLDKRRINPIINKSKRFKEKHEPSLGDQAVYYTKNMTEAGIEQTLDVGKHALIGEIIYSIIKNTLHEFTELLKKLKYTTISDYIKNTVDGLKQIFIKVAKDLKDIINNTMDAMASNFISVIITTIINIFVTTCKRVVRMIKEGVLFILKAANIIIFTPDGMTRSEAFDLAVKMISSGLIAISGIALEELIRDKIVACNPLLAASGIADHVAGFISGLITGLLIALVFSLLDKIDLFGVTHERKFNFIIQRLTTLQQEADHEKDTLLSAFNTSLSDFDEIDSKIYSLLNSIHEF